MEGDVAPPRLHSGHLSQNPRLRLDQLAVEQVPRHLPPKPGETSLEINAGVKAWTTTAGPV